jgi:hypothetical protein
MSSWRPELENDATRSLMVVAPALITPEMQAGAPIADVVDPFPELKTVAIPADRSSPTMVGNGVAESALSHAPLLLYVPPLRLPLIAAIEWLFRME